MHKYCYGKSEAKVLIFHRSLDEMVGVFVVVSRSEELIVDTMFLVVFQAYF